MHSVRVGIRKYRRRKTRGKRKSHRGRKSLPRRRRRYSTRRNRRTKLSRTQRGGDEFAKWLKKPTPGTARRRHADEIGELILLPDLSNENRMTTLWTTMTDPQKILWAEKYISKRLEQPVRLPESLLDQLERSQAREAAFLAWETAKREIIEPEQ